VTRRSRYRLRKAQERAHLVEGLLLALANIDEVVRIIRGSADVAEARAALIERFALSDVQAGYILDMQLRRLVALEVEKLEAELAALRATIAELEAVLGDPALLRRVIGEELAAVAVEHGTPRRTVLVGGDLKALVTRSGPTRWRWSTSLLRRAVLSRARARTPLPPADRRRQGRRRTGRVRQRRRRLDDADERRASWWGGHLRRCAWCGQTWLDLPAVPGVTTGALSVRGGAPVSEFAALSGASGFWP
jgi:DNA gyrase subunit A